MARVKAEETVRLSNGDVMTLGEALDKGRLKVRRVANYQGPRGPTREAYFADEPGTMLGFEISRYLYQSREGSAS